MKKTEYKLEQKDNNLRVLKNGKIEAQGFGDEESALHAIWVIEGKVFLNEINPIPGSMANYLFDDFEGVIERLALSLKKEKEIIIDYAYINQIQSAKGGKS